MNYKSWSRTGRSWTVKDGETTEHSEPQHNKRMEVMQSPMHKTAKVTGGHYDGQTGTITNTELRAGEWRALVEFSDGGGYWYLPWDFEVVDSEPLQDFDDPMGWGADQIRHCYDCDFDMRLQDLARMTGRTVADVRRILRA